MNIVVITGSPHKGGTSAALAAKFIQGACENDHKIFRFDAAFKKVHPCVACNECRKRDGMCTFKDDMEELNQALRRADAVAFFSPVYYSAVSAQLKKVMDRLYANDRILRTKRRTALMLTCADKTPDSAEGAIVSYKSMMRYFGWDIVGTVVACGCWRLSDLAHTDYANQAYELGKQI